MKRRAHRRTPVERDLEVYPVDADRKPTLSPFRKKKSPAAPGKLVDVGCGGLQVEIRGKLEVGTEVDVHITGTSGKVQRARGTVRHVRGDDGSRMVGIALTEPMLTLGDPSRSGRPVAAAAGKPGALVIDDDPGVRHVLERFLTSRGMQVTSVPSAEEGLEVLRSSAPNLMLLDLRMDGMTGGELLEAMRAEGLRCPHIWAMSGAATNDEAVSALGLGASQFLNKPFDLDHLDYCLQLIAPIL
jgi:CheY-like chemotaxis protein